MSIERDFNPEEITAKWEAFFKEPHVMSNFDVFNLARDIVSLRHNGNIHDQNQGAELLSRPSLMINWYGSLHDAYLNIEARINGDPHLERLGFKLDKDSKKVSVNYDTNFPRVSAIFPGQKIEAFPSVQQISLSQDQLKSLAQKLWHAYKITERWVRMDDFIAKQEEELFLQGV